LTLILGIRYDAEHFSRKSNISRDSLFEEQLIGFATNPVKLGKSLAAAVGGVLWQQIQVLRDQHRRVRELRPPRVLDPRRVLEALER